MAFNFSSILDNSCQGKITDPEEIFRRLTSGKNLWLGQGDALRDWHEHRDKSDILVAMDTGMGKTIVGLTIAHSLLNEKQRQVIYICASKQLVQQTKTEAEELGIEVATYMNGEFENEFKFHECNAPLITTYQALFNGKSKFMKLDLGGLIFDDSHVAGNILKENFTLSFKKEDDVYKHITALFQSYYECVNQDTRYRQMLNCKNDDVFILPPHEIYNHITIIKDILMKHNIDENKDTLFAWEYLRDHLDLCLLIVDQTKLEITPPIIPAKTLPCFENTNISRVYLSATHVDTSHFPKYFGNKIKYKIEHKSGKSKAKRFFLTPWKSKISFSHTQAIRNTILNNCIHDYRGVIIAPSFQGANSWKLIDESVVLEADSNNITDQIDHFTDSENKKLILANRYDGIDFPDDSCRILLFDGLPSESSLQNKFLSNQLKAHNYLRSELNAKILQGIGRIFRGADDYGIVFLIDKSEINWIFTPKNKDGFPKTLQTQLDFGDGLNQMIDNEDSLRQMVLQILHKDQNLIDVYEQFMYKTIKDSEMISHAESDNAEKISLIESRLYSCLWNREYEKISELIDDLMQRTEGADTLTLAWYYFLVGICLLIMDDESYVTYFYKANKKSKDLPGPIGSNTTNFESSDYGLVNSVIQAITHIKKSDQIQIMNKEFKYLDNIEYSKQDRKHEVGIEYLGNFLGFKTERPDNTYKTGPDVLWETQDGYFILLELKTNKREGNYSKKETAQFLDHIEWVKTDKNVSSDKIAYNLIIGPHNKVNYDANPSSDLYMISLDEFKIYADELISLVESCYSRSFSNTSQIENLVKELQLSWGDKFKKIPKIKALDLK